MSVPAVGDALRGARMFEPVNVPVLGVVENMSGFTDPETGRRWELFASGGGQRLADELGLPLLGQIPLEPGLTGLADRGVPALIGAATSPAAGVLREIAAGGVPEVETRDMVLPAAPVSLNGDAPPTALFFIEDHALRPSFHYAAKIRATLGR